MTNPHRPSRYVRSRDPGFHARQFGERVANSLNTSLARVVELADTGGLNPPLLRKVRVRSPPRAPTRSDISTRRRSISRSRPSEPSDGEVGRPTRQVADGLAVGASAQPRKCLTHVVHPSDGDCAFAR